MTVELFYETHSTSLDNEAGISSGWRDIGLSETGRRQAADLGARYGGTADAVYCSDLQRAVETAEIAFAHLELRRDARLRECDYGTLTGASSKVVAAEWPKRIDEPFPDGESVKDVVRRVRAFLDDVARDRGHERVVLIGHRGPKLALDHLLGGITLEEAVAARHAWQPGWRYTL